MIIATYPNTEDGIEGRVNRLENGNFSVTLFDTDAMETLPTCIIYAVENIDKAHAKAAEVVA